MNWQEKTLKLMKERGWNQKMLAEKSGITEASLSRYLAGERNPRMDIIVNLAKAFNIRTDYLLEDDSVTNLTPYTEIATAIARKGSELSIDEKNELIRLILNAGE